MPQARPGRNPYGRRDSRENQPEVPINRDPTPEEISQVSAMGFGTYEAGFAIRMAGFNVERAIEILLTDQPRLLTFIEEEN